LWEVARGGAASRFSLRQLIVDIGQSHPHFVRVIATPALLVDVEPGVVFLLLSLFFERVHMVALQLHPAERTHGGLHPRVVNVGLAGILLDVESDIADVAFGIFAIEFEIELVILGASAGLSE
jgi:hypothetical protein